jgi:protein-L-isoaspartate(D-aspartate) O-methyltransferase
MFPNLEEQLCASGRGISDPRVLAAMHAVPREEFVPQEWKLHAYDDRPLPIGDGQTISQPYIVASMSERLAVFPGCRVLEIGAGCGYQSAVLAELGATVFAIEIVEGLARRAEETLNRLGYGDRVTIRCGDGAEGWPEEAPFDGILVACTAPGVPPKLVEQLRFDGGRLILPLERRSGNQELVEVRRDGDRVTETPLMGVRFVPMTGSFGAQAP